MAAVDKSARLTLNEAQCDNDGDWGRSIRPLLAGLVDRLRDAGAPLHAIGLESHLQPKFPHNYKEFARYVADFGAQDLEVYISEFDVDDSVYPDSAAERDAAAAALAGEFLSNVLAVPAVRLIATWQLSDRYSWYRSLPRKHMFGPARMPRPLPFDDDGRPKPMRQAMIEAFRARAAGAGRPTP